jgi:DNA modification methylase
MINKGMMSSERGYSEYLIGKKKKVEPCGFTVEESELNPLLKPFQAAIVKWALIRGRAAIFCDTGLGKTFQQLEWARHVHIYTGKPVLIFAPLAVSQQTKRESDKFNIQCSVAVVEKQSDVINGINITNYEKMHHFTPSEFGGLVLDESSILKSFDGKTRMALMQFARPIMFRLACSATPAPNEILELANHADFLDVTSGKEIKATFFIQDGNNSNQWRIKGHAEKPFWEFVAKWAVAVRKPSDIGYDDEGYILPEPVYHDHVVDSKVTTGCLFAMEARTLLERRQARRDSSDERVKKVAELISKEPYEQWLIWCDLNIESEKLKKAIPDSVEVKGADSNEHKEKSLAGFSTGNPHHLISKPSIAGFGMNWQHCSRVVFVGLSDSFESLYQATRRVWRFGQKRTVHIHVVTAQSEGAVVANIKRKEKNSDKMYDQIIEHMESHDLYKSKAERTEMDYNESRVDGDGFTVYNGDSCEVLKLIESDSIGMSVFSPPFPGMYAYTDSSRDIGNSGSTKELLNHFKFITPELLRVLMPGRSVLMHITQEVLFKKDNGFTGLYDFRGDLIRHMTDHGFIFASERMIDKDPQLKAARTKDAGLAMRTAATDSAKLTGTMPDYLLQFRKPGDNPKPIRALINHPSDPTKRNPDGWVTAQEWIDWASAVWYGHHHIGKGGIKETDVLPVRSSKDDKDEKHLCPLQLGVIERCVKLWSAPGEKVLSPFMGIGSEGYVSLKNERRFVGIELKKSYFDVACENLRSVKGRNLRLF